MIANAELPSYQNPPVNEVVCGVRFEPITRFTLPYFGLLWSKIRAEYPTIEHASPLVSGATLSVDAASGVPLPRVWFISSTDDRLIQFQVDHLYFNWRKRQEPYPRFSEVFVKFEQAREHLVSLCSEMQLDIPAVLEHELTYINHIAQGEGWSTLEDLPNIFPGIFATDRQLSFLPPPKNVALNIRFELPKDQGRLEVKLSQANRARDGHPLLVLQFSAKGGVTGPSWETSREWFELAHTWIVNGFADLTSKKIQEGVWQRLNPKQSEEIG